MSGAGFGALAQGLSNGYGAAEGYRASAAKRKGEEKPQSGMEMLAAKWQGVDAANAGTAAPTSVGIADAGRALNDAQIVKQSNDQDEQNRQTWELIRSMESRSAPEQQQQQDSQQSEQQSSNMSMNSLSQSPTAASSMSGGMGTGGGGSALVTGGPGTGTAATYAPGGFGLGGASAGMTYGGGTAAGLGGTGLIGTAGGATSGAATGGASFGLGGSLVGGSGTVGGSTFAAGAGGSAAGGGAAAGGSAAGGLASAGPWAALIAAIGLNENYQKKTGNRDISHGKQITEAITGKVVERDAPVWGEKVDKGNKIGIKGDMEFFGDTSTFDFKNGLKKFDDTTAVKTIKKIFGR